MLRLAVALPLPDETRQELVDWLGSDPYKWLPSGRKVVWQRACSLCNDSNAREYSLYLADKAARTWEEWTETWGTGE
jgi:hypothetical protein